jgi:hypothetical protein
MSSSKSPDWHSFPPYRFGMADSRPHNGPSLVLLAAMCIALLFGGLAIGVAIGGLMPLPYGPIGPVQHYVQTQSLAIRIIAVAVFGSSVLLAVFAATVSARLRWLGDVGAAPIIALTGGILAAGSLGLTGLLGWTLSRPEITGDTTLVRALYLLTFLVGGAAHVVALGVLIAGIATSGLALGLLPRALAWVGIAIAALCELTMLVLAWQALGPVLPVARVAALAWLLVAGARLPARRSDSASAS